VISIFNNLLLTLTARDAEIARKMAEMPKLIETYREERRKSRARTEFEKVLGRK
jgi:hypothetical protein